MTLKEYINKKPPSEITLALIKRLKEYSEEDDFILGVLAQSVYDKDRQLILDYINDGSDVSYESILLFSLEIGQQRDNHYWYFTVPTMWGRFNYALEEEGERISAR